MNVTGATACLDCAAGSYSHALGAWNCTLCGNGTFSGPGQSVCTDCAPGKYVLGEGNTECKFCEKSKYQPTVANTECLQCPRNTGAREISGVCTGACKGSTTKDDCLCKPGFTRFGQTSDECTAFDFNVANMGQSTACPSKNNIIGVTLQTNAELTTAVQEIAVVSAGKGYADATLDVVEPGGVGFSGKAITRPVDGSISGVEIVDGGAQFTGFPKAVNIYFSPGCAEIDDACTSTKQEGTIARIQIVNPGSGYIQGRVNISGGGGTGATADFVTDAVGVITSVRFADVASHGQGYSSPAALALLYPMAARCDKLKNNGVVDYACRQAGTITSLQPGIGTTTACNTDVRLHAVGGGGEGFYAVVVKISPLGRIQQWEIVNHGTGYTSDPFLQIESHPSCTCNAKAGSTVGAFNDCVSFLRARDAELTAQPALGAILEATTGTRVILTGLENGTMPFRHDAVPIYAIGSPSISTGETQSCGVLKNGTAVCFGKSEQTFTKADVQTWVCGYEARYYRFTPLRTRGGGETVQLAEIEFYARNSDVKLVPVGASNPGGINPPGLSEEKATTAASDGDVETRWATLNKKPLQLDFGSQVIIERYRWMTASGSAPSDPVQWKIEASNQPLESESWVTIHEVSSLWHGEYTVGTGKTSRGSVYFLRNEWTRFWAGTCSMPEYQLWRSISVHAFHGCGINNAGIGYCWGHNSFKQLTFPDSPCSCEQKYNTYCSCTSANYLSTVYRKVKLNAGPGQCSDDRCYNTYADGTCEEKECRFIYSAEQCSLAGKALQLIPQDARVMNPGNSPFNPKGCYVLSNSQASSRVRFNRNNQSSDCTENENCVCQDCPSFSFIHYSDNAYCGGTFDSEEKTRQNELVGAKSVQACKEACGMDDTCDFFTFYPEKTSVACSPCCFKKDSECPLINPNSVIPKVGDVNPSSTWSYLSCGYLHTCGVTMAGSLKCWGFNRDEQASPPAVLATRKWRFVTSGKFHSCGILDDLTAHCWGANDKVLDTGQIAPLPGLGSFKWRALSCGVWHTCGITQGGDLHCWGCGGIDSLGRTRGISPTGEDVNKGQCDTSKVKSPGVLWDMISAAEFHSCGVTSTGEAHCWGCKCNPTACPAWNSSDIDLGQCDVPSGHQWSQIQAGRRHTCGLTIHGELLCWGCILNVTKPFFSKSGGVEFQNASLARTFDLGQCHPQKGFKTWMNSAAFSAKAQWTNRTDRGLELQVRSNTIVGADYFFGFPIQNPPQIQPHANTAVFTEGLALPSTDFQHSSPAVYGGLAVTDCQEGTSSNEDGECVPCVAGTYALDCGVEACTPCMPGQYSVAGSTRCRLCGVGRYSASYGSQNCSACPSGTKGPITGGTSIYDACVQCKAGKYTQTYHIWDEYGESWTDMGATTCIDCPRGYYCPGGSDKIRCGPRTYNGNSGANESAQCLECPHGLRCNGLWPRNVCKTPDGTGFDNGSVFTEIESCERACFSIEMEGGRGKCISVQGQNNGCAEGYDGKICHRCSDGYYPEFLEFQCKKCPSVWYQAWLLLAYSGCVLGIPLICDLTKVDSRISVYLRIMLMFFQNQDLSLSVNVRWPTSMITFVRALRIMNWDLMFTNPQCWFGNTDSMWQLVFLVEICFPLGSLALIWLLAAAFELHGKWTERISRSFWRLVGFFCLWYSIPFVGSCLRTVECSCVPDGYEMHRPSWDNCSFTGIFGSEPGRSVLTNNPFIVCHGESHWRQYTGAFGALLWVFIGIPMGLFFLPDMEPSIWNPFPVEKRSVRAKGLMKVVNIGVAKDQSSGISKSPGTGIMQFLSDSIREMQELITMGGEHISTLNELKDNASKSGRQKEKSKIARSIVNVEKQVQVCHERTALLEMTMDVMQDSLRHVPDSDVAKARQLSAIQTTEVSYRSGLLNFVEPVHIQRQRTKEMRWVLTDAPWSVKNKRGESFIFSAPPIVLWRHLQSLLQKNMKTLDVIRKNALKALFLLCTILAALPALAFTFLYSFWKGASMLMPKRFSPYQNVYFIWAKYGHVGEFKGEIRRVQPRYAQNEVIDNDQEVRGCVALLWRAHGEQHESTLYKVRRVQASGAIGVIVVNETNWSFTPRIVAENYATFQAIDIPVMGIRACDVHMIADGSIATFHYLRDYPRIFGLKRLKAFMTLVSMQTLVENYWPEMQWFEGVVWVRRGALVLMKYLLIRTPEIQACCILAVNFFYFCYTLFRPFRLEDFNRMECISAISCLMSSMFVVAVTVMYGKNSEGIPGLELNGSAGEFEDLGRRYVFYVLSMTNVILLIVVGVFLAQPVVSLSSHYILLWITNWLRPPLQPPTAKPKEDTSLPPDIDKVCYSMLHAIEEHSRVLAHHSHVRGAIDVAYGVLQEQEDVIARHAFNQMRALRQKPWTFVVGRGASGIHTDKEVYCFRHHFGGMVVEIPSHSAGDIRMKNSAEGQILSCSGDGILFKRDSFFSPLLIQRLEAISDRINRRERPILISESGLEDDRQCGGKYKAPITRWRSFARAHKARSNVDDEREALQWLCEKCNLQNVIEDHRCSRCLSHRAQEKAVWRKDDDDEYQQADDVAAAYSLGEEAPKGASGLSWQNVGESKPADGEELQNTELAMALESTSTFQSWEWDSFGIQGLRLDHYIRSGPCYFKPAEEDSEFVPVDALYCPSRFGRWKSFCHNPDLVVAHRMKGIEVYFTRTSAVIMSCQDRAVILREGSQEAETVPLPVAREFLNSSSVVLPGGSALRAVETSLQVLSRRKKLPQWQVFLLLYFHSSFWPGANASRHLFLNLQLSTTFVSACVNDYGYLQICMPIASSCCRCCCGCVASRQCISSHSPDAR